MRKIYTLLIVVFISAFGFASHPGGRNQGVTPGIAEGDFGDNQWNVYGYNGTNFDAYAGYYVDANFNFNTQLSWDASLSPSYAAGYVGDFIQEDHHAYRAKRKGFPEGCYTINIIGHDDDTQLFINGVSVFLHNGCCDSHSGVWTGILNADSEVVIATQEIDGASYSNYEFVLNTVATPVGGTLSADQTIVCGNADWNLALSGYTGTIVKWQKASDAAFTAPEDINYNGDTLDSSVSGNLGGITYFRAVIGISCWTDYSSVASVTVEDKDIPTVITQNITVQLDATGNVTVTPDQIDNGSTDGCGIANMSLDTTTFTGANIGNNNTVTLTVTDVSGNVATGTAMVTVQDITPPNVMTQNITVQLDATGNATITPAQIDNGSADNSSGNVSLSLDKTTFSCSDVGIVSTPQPVAFTDMGAVAQDTHSYGGGYNPNTNEFWYPEWDGSTIYKYDAAHNATGSFTAPVSGIMQLWMDKSSSDYYTANYYSGTVNRISGDNIVWSYNLGYSASAITTSDLYVYAKTEYSNTIIVLDKTTGALVNNITLSGYFSTYGGLVYANGTIYIAGYDGYGITTVPYAYNAIHAFNAETGAYINSVQTAQEAITTVFDGETIRISNGGNTINGYKVSNGNAYGQTGDKVTLTVTDKSGNTAAAAAYVTVTATVQDTVLPVVNTQNVTVQLDAAGNASITTAQIDNGSTDNCRIVSMSLDKTAFTCADAGDNTVTLTVTDNFGNTASAPATVTVEDKVAPIVATQNITVQLDENGTATAAAADVNNGSADNCGIANMSLDKTNFTCDNIGDNTVTLTVTDGNGNSGTGTAIVTVEDKVVPIAIAKNITVQLDETGNVTITPDQVDNGSFDNCAIASMSLDKTAFTCADVKIGNTCKGCIPGTLVVLTVTDVSGNTSRAYTRVTVKDEVKPTITAPEAVTINLTEGCSVTGVPLGTPVTADNCSVVSVVNDAPQSFPAGSTTVTWTVTDNSNNTAQATQVVTVKDGIAPTVIIQNITVQLDETGSVTITPDQIDNGSYDNCTIAGMSLDKTTFTCEDVANTAPVKCKDCNIGTPVTLTVTDVNGNSATAMAFVMVHDLVAPTVVTKDITVQLDAEGNATVNAEDVNDGSSDACGIATKELDMTSFTCDNAGDNIVALYVTDSHGNTSMDYATVTIVDNMAPSVTTQNVTIQLDENAGASIGLEDVVVTSSDNCGVDTQILSQTDFTCQDAGDNTVVLTVTDNNGNVTTKNITVTVGGLPTVQPIIGDAGIGVAGGTITLTSETAGGAWSSSNVEVATVDPSTGVVTGVAAGTAVITYTVTFGECQLTASKEITVSSLGNDQFDLSKLSFYPNPVKDVLNVSYSSDMKTVSVINLLGQELSTQTVNANLARIDMTGLPNAAYMIKINTDNAVKIIKVIKE